VAAPRTKPVGAHRLFVKHGIPAEDSGTTVKINRAGEGITVHLLARLGV